MGLIWPFLGGQKSEIVTNLCAHGLVSALSRSDLGKTSPPSYIPSGVFVLALLDLVKNAASAAPAAPVAAVAGEMTFGHKITTVLGLPDLDHVKVEVAGMESGVPRDCLLTLIRHANNRLDVFQDTLNAISNFDPEAAGVAETLQTEINRLPASATVDFLNGLLARSKNAAGEPNAAAFQDALLSWPLSFDLSSSIARLPSAALRQSLQTLLDYAGNDPGAFKVALEAWFNDAMDRVSGWYKRFAQNWMLVIGFFLAAIFNVNTIKIVEVLSQSPNLAKAVASQAEAYGRRNPNPTSAQGAAKAQPERDWSAKRRGRGWSRRFMGQDAEANGADRANLDATSGDATDAQFRALVAKLSEAGIPIGWNCEQLQELGLANRQWTLGKIVMAAVKVCSWRRNFMRLMHWLSAHFAVVGGWFITALAGSLGAPFWFDLLNRFINIRNAGKAPEEADHTGKPKAAKAPSLNTLGIE
jgi:hypothetical protein